jgi:NCS1 family nucleobase:cation symporter-1
MATGRMEKVIEEETQPWGVQPTAPRVRRLRGLDLFVLWGDLGIGLLVLVTGALLVPALSLRQALGAIVVGSILGCIPLALVGLAGAREGLPGMVLLRPTLGIRGSYLPTVLNVAQLIGWTAFELWVMALVAAEVSGPILGIESFYVWLGVAAAVCLLLSLGGPILVVRRWMERFGVWVLLAAAGWITVRLLATADLGGLWSGPGAGGFPSFWPAVDLVIAMPVSWIPLVADYNRFARPGARAAAGTYLGYLAANVWFYALGALLIVGPLADQDLVVSGPAPAVLAAGIAAVAGTALVPVVLLVGETDEAFADIYSAAVSSQNMAPRLNQRLGVVAVTAIGVGLAAWLFRLPGGGTETFEFFLFLIGSVFVPLFGVFLADYFVLRRRSPYRAAALFDPHGPYRYLGGFNPAAIAAWVLGFAVYHWIAPTPLEGWSAAVERFFAGWLSLPFPLFGGEIPASVAAFVVAFLLYIPLGALVRRQEPAGER